MRWIAWIVLVGCGRIGLDPLADGAAVRAPDSAASADAIASVVCSGGTCASSMDDFSEVQGQAGWWYGTWDITDDVDGIYEPSDFQIDADFNGFWRPTDWAPDPDPHFTWAYIAAWGGHPGSYPLHRADVRRWVSTVAGAALACVASQVRYLRRRRDARDARCGRTAGVGARRRG